MSRRTHLRRAIGVLGDPRLQGENFDRNLGLTGAVRELARELGATPAQVALAWLLGKSESLVPIPGSRSIAHLEENLAACSVRLPSAMMEKLDRALPPGATSGTRYTAAMQAFVDKE